MKKKNIILKSIGAILAGFVTVFALSVITDLILEKFGFFPPLDQPQAYLWWMLLIALIYRSIYSVIGFYLTAKLAPSNPMRLVIILGIIGTIVAGSGVIINWNLGNNWYPIFLAAVTLPCAWLGGKLAGMKKKK